MEPPLLPLHPHLPGLLSSLGLRVVDALKWNVLACAPDDSVGAIPTVVLKFGTDKRKTESMEYERRIVSEIFPSIDQRFFERLVLPEYISDGAHRDLRWMLMKFIPGKTLIHSWSELSFKQDLLGGKIVPLEVAAASVDVLRDLRSVDVATLPAFVHRFDFPVWLDAFRIKSDAMVSLGLLERDTVDRALAFFGAKAADRYQGTMFTNGDFYPRNFVMLDSGRVAVTDWVGGVDPWEFVAMYAWLLMWGNSRWQVEYVAQIKRHFPVDVNEMQAGLLVKSFEQAYRWREEPEESIGFARTQMLAYFRQCLDAEYVREIFS